MTNFHLPNESFQYAYAAHDQAKRAGIHANYGYRYKQVYYELESMLRKWKDLMINAPILLHNSLFVLFAIADMIISWGMIRDLVSNTGILPQFEFFATLTFCLLINSWAAVTAHFIGKGWSKEIQDWERWNFIFIKNRSQSPTNIVSDEMRRDVKKARFVAIFSGLILVGLVAVIIYYRNSIAPFVSESINADSEGGDVMSQPPGLNLVLTYLPLAILIGELFTGDYFWYSIRRIQIILSRNKNRRLFLKHKEACGMEDQLAVQYAEMARNNPQNKLEIIGDLEKSHMRFKFRTQQNDDYIDPVENFRKFGFNFKYRGNGRPVSNTHVFGVLPNGAKTGDYLTDEDGKVTIPLEGEFDRLVAVGVLNREYLGPFQANGEHYIDLPEAIIEPISSLNGQH